MTRSEHLAWCKTRALEYCKVGNIDDALASMLSDLGKHPETVDSVKSCGPLPLDIASRPRPIQEPPMSDELVTPELLLMAVPLEIQDNPWVQAAIIQLRQMDAALSLPPPALPEEPKRDADGLFRKGGK